MTPTNTIHFAANLKAIRANRGKTQADMANYYGIPHKRYQAYEEERSTPKYEALAAMAQRLGMKIDELLTEKIK